MKVRCALSSQYFPRWKHFLERAPEGEVGLQHSGTWDVTECKNNMILVGLEPTIPSSVGRCLIHWATGPLGKGCLDSSHPQPCKGCSGNWAQVLSQSHATRPVSQLMASAGRSVVFERALELQHSGTWDFSAVTEWKNDMILVGLEPTIPSSVGRCRIHWATGPLSKGCLHPSYPQSCKGCSRTSRPNSKSTWRPRHPLMSPLAHGGKICDVCEKCGRANKPDLALWKSDAPSQTNFLPGENTFWGAPWRARPVYNTVGHGISLLSQNERII